METLLEDRPVSDAKILRIPQDASSAAPASPVDEPSGFEGECPDPEVALAELLRLLAADGTDPSVALAGYLVSEDPAYLPECGNARALARHIGRNRMLTLLIDTYVRAHEGTGEA